MRPASNFPQLFIAAMLLTIACSESTTPPSPTKLAFTVQPTTTTAGSPISPALAVAIQDDAGNTVTTSTDNITLATGSNTPGMTLAGNTTVAAVNGVATFPGLSINVASNYTLSATSPNLASATSAQFAVVTGPATKLGFTVQPVAALANADMSSVSVAVQDAVGNTVTRATTITLSIQTNPAGGSLWGNPSVATVNGTAVFSDLRITNAGIGYTLMAAAAGLTPAVSTPFNITIGPASKLVFTTPPATSPPGATINPAVAVTVQDVAGNTVLITNLIITVAIGTNPANGTLTGHTALAPENGVSMFSDLVINNAGDGYTLTATSPNLTSAISGPFSIRNPLVFTSVSAGYFHSCGLATGGVAYCWGQNAEGPTKSFPSSTAPMPLTGGFTFVNAGAGRDHACGVTNGGAARCWGDHQGGKLGGGAAQGGPPILVSGGLTFAAATAGYAHSCGVTTAGAGYCWGENLGVLGNDIAADSNVPVAVSGGLTFATISPGRYLTCGLTTGGKAYCWGDNSSGALGDGTTTRRGAPAAVSGGLSFAVLSAGGFHACGLTTGGLAYCWGLNQYRELGNGTNNSSVPVPVTGGLTFTMISAGNRHNCALTAAGVAYCWGDNSSGALGNGTNLTSSLPVAVSGGLTFTSISAGRFHTCGVATGGAAYCWGSNDLGLVGDGTTTSRLVPVPVR